MSIGRRRFLRNVGLAGLGAVGAGPLLNACATSTSSGPVTQTGGAVTVQSNLSAPAAKTAIEALVKGFNDRNGATASVNTVASETFRTQLPSYLTSANPPDTYTWYPGSLLSGYAEKGLLDATADTVTMTSGDDPRTGLRLTRRFSLADRGYRLELTAKNVSDRPATVHSVGGTTTEVRAGDWKRTVRLRRGQSVTLRP
jgi:hypothetical protein